MPQVALQLCNAILPVQTEASKYLLDALMHA